jgi:hypothetical protein
MSERAKRRFKMIEMLNDRAAFTDQLEIAAAEGWEWDLANHRVQMVDLAGRLQTLYTIIVTKVM